MGEPLFDQKTDYALEGANERRQCGASPNDPIRFLSADDFSERRASSVELEDPCLCRGIAGN